MPCLFFPVVIPFAFSVFWAITFLHGCTSHKIKEIAPCYCKALFLCPAAFPGLLPIPGFEPRRPSAPVALPLCYIGIKSGADPHKRRIPLCKHIQVLIYHAINSLTALLLDLILHFKDTLKKRPAPNRVAKRRDIKKGVKNEMGRKTT